MGGDGLIERGGELAVLDAALERARASGGVVVIEGPAGIGKTRLIDEARERAGGFDVLSGRGGLLEQDIAFGVVRQLFERRVARSSDAERAELLAGAAAPAARALDIEPERGLTTADGVSGSLYGLFWLLANLAERRPVLIAVDDMHWADRGSVEFLAFVARRIQGLPVLVVVGARDDEARANGVATNELLAHAEVLRPAGLSADGVDALVRGTFGVQASPEIIEACRVSTGGNPFYLRELLAAVAPPDGDPRAISIDAVRDTVPSTVAHSILLRLGRLADPAPRLAVAAALPQRRLHGGVAVAGRRRVGVARSG